MYFRLGTAVQLEKDHVKEWFLPSHGHATLSADKKTRQPPYDNVVVVVGLELYFIVRTW